MAVQKCQQPSHIFHGHMRACNDMHDCFSQECFRQYQSWPTHITCETNSYSMLVLTAFEWYHLKVCSLVVQVKDFCEDKGSCRHCKLLHYFGETLANRTCRRNCDVCVKSWLYTQTAHLHWCQLQNVSSDRLFYQSTQHGTVLVAWKPLIIWLAVTKSNTTF